MKLELDLSWSTARLDSIGFAPAFSVAPDQAAVLNLDSQRRFQHLSWPDGFLLGHISLHTLSGLKHSPVCMVRLFRTAESVLKSFD